MRVQLEGHEDTVRIRYVVRKCSTLDEAMALVKLARRPEIFPGTGFETEARHAVRTCGRDDVAQHRAPYSPSAHRLHGMHRLDLPVSRREPLQRSDSHQRPILPDRPEADIGCLQPGEIQRMGTPRRRFRSGAVQMSFEQRDDLRVAEVTRKDFHHGWFPDPPSAGDQDNAAVAPQPNRRLPISRHPGYTEVMANQLKKAPGNAIGEFFVDRTCIACETCAQLAPETYDEAGEFFRVRRQPSTREEIRRATRAVVACPVGAIGTLHHNNAKEVARDFPLPIERPVYYCGFNSRESFGANSYLVTHPVGNWLVDSPHFTSHLVRSFEAMGGIRYIFLTHQDDVADAAQYARHFNAARIIHQDDSAAQPGAEIVLQTNEAIEIERGFRVIPTPGHTRGHCVMLYEERFLFTGDHLWWEPDVRRLGASRSACWSRGGRKPPRCGGCVT
jgi:ferredoxin